MKRYCDALCFCYLIFTLTTFAFSGCGLIQRDPDATNVEDTVDEMQISEKKTPEIPVTRLQKRQQLEEESLDDLREDSDEDSDNPKPINIEPSPQRSKARAELKKFTHEEEREAFEKARIAETRKNYSKAEKLWADFLQDYSGLSHFDEAQYHYGFCLIQNQKNEEAVSVLQSVVQRNTQVLDRPLINDCRILLTEALINLERYDEALAVTYEVLPDSKAEEAAGIKRKAKAVGTSLGSQNPEKLKQEPRIDQKTQLYTLRGRIFSSLGKPELAQMSLSKARTLLESLEKTKSSSTDTRKLRGQWAWRQLEVRFTQCNREHPLPEHLSEALFLAYAEAYYSCSASARALLCDVRSSKNEELFNKAKSTYQKLVETPLTFKDHLPPASQSFKHPEQKTQYENEMKALVVKTFDENSKDFKNIESCDLKNIF